MIRVHERGWTNHHEAAVGAAARRPRALVLHRDPKALELLRHSLEARGCTVLTADDATSGLALLLEELLELDVLVTALDLPDGNARSLAHFVRHTGGEQDLALVVVATGLPAETGAELLALGVDGIADWRAGAGTMAGIVLRAVEARQSARRGRHPYGGAPTPAAA
jgi:CheY-like chemotaxis protein